MPFVGPHPPSAGSPKGCPPLLRSDFVAEPICWAKLFVTNAYIGKHELTL